MRTIGITGASGFVGRHLLDIFAGRGYRVIAFGRDPITVPPGSEFRRYDMEEALSPSALADVDVIVHCAFIRAGRGELNVADRNIHAVRALSDAAIERGATFVFLSTSLARPDAKSEYGRHKYESETMLSERGALIIRPGLVVGNGGLIRTLYRTSRGRIVPLIDGGSQVIPVIGATDLGAGIALAIDLGIRGRHAVCAPGEVPIAVIARTLASQFHLHPAYISVPWGMAYAAAAAAERLGLPLPITTETLLGMNGFVTEAPSSVLAEHGFRASTWPELLPSLSFEPPDGIPASPGE